MRFFQSSSALTLSPGGYGSIVVAYVFAAPVGPQPNCAGSSNCVPPGNPTFLSNPTRMANGTGASLVDTISGFRDWTDVNGDGIVEQSEFTVVNGSLLQKSIFAQTLFDGKFLLPAAPASPEFFLIPGDNSVTVMWQPSSTETGAGDPFFQVASTPLRGSGCRTASTIRATIQNDVEGLPGLPGPGGLSERADPADSVRLQRALRSTTTPARSIPDLDCAPEFALTTSCPGLRGKRQGRHRPRCHGHPQPDSADRVTWCRSVRAWPCPSQQRHGADRYGDTAVTGGALNGPCGPKSRCPPLDDTGVPFVYMWTAQPRNNFRYFYSVTAFDVNSFQSGNSSLESARSTKSVTPVKSASNTSSSAQIVASTLEGRGVVLDTSVANPTLDATTGRFSGRFPAGQQLGRGPRGTGLPSAERSWLVRGPHGQHRPRGSLRLRRQAHVLVHRCGERIEYGVLGRGGSAAGVPDRTAPSRPSPRCRSTTVWPSNSAATAHSSCRAGSTSRAPASSTRSCTARGCVNGRPGFDTGAGCSYNGSRWFDGPSPTTNETLADPQACDVANTAARR